MSSKQLQSILKNIPSATAKGENQNSQETKIENIQNEKIELKSPEHFIEVEEMERIVAEVPKSLKRQIKRYIEENKGMTEKTVILKALKTMGFQIDSLHLLDRRTTRK